MPVTPAIKPTPVVVPLCWCGKRATHDDLCIYRELLNMTSTVK